MGATVKRTKNWIFGGYPANRFWKAHVASFSPVSLCNHYKLVHLSSQLQWAQVLLLCSVLRWCHTGDWANFNELCPRAVTCYPGGSSLCPHIWMHGEWLAMADVNKVPTMMPITPTLWTVAMRRAATALHAILRQEEEKKKQVWVWSWLLRRETLGRYEHLLQEVSAEWGLFLL